jgi:hypothetical protein
VCGKELWLGSTTNEWNLWCGACDVRYNSKLKVMDLTEHDYRCDECGWSERQTRETLDYSPDTSPWQRYRIHLFLQHSVPLPTERQFDVKGVLIDGD